ncbi:MAG TPA: IS701 family transposase [Gemmata sp.]|nr:IS701 family transposase [Gemmata sp.]
MEYELEGDGQQRLEEYFERIGKVLGDDKRRASFATYAIGLLSDGERKSMEPIAARSCADPTRIDAEHQRLAHFVSNSNWPDMEVRREAAAYALEVLTKREPVVAWIFDDTGFLKQGTHSVGVQRQYTGSAGKITNCQIGVSLTVATPTEHVPIDFELYLPEAWTGEPARRQEARIPVEVQFQTKPELAIAMLRRAVAAGVPRVIALGDAAYGHSSPLRRACRELELPYGMGVMSTDRVWRLDGRGRRADDEPVTIEDFAVGLGRGAFRKTTWRQGSKAPLSSYFAMERVHMVQGDGVDGDEPELVWLLMEWERGESAPTKYHVLWLPVTPRCPLTRKKAVRIVKQRWRTERVYEDLKGELGLDHFEGRRFRGWHHHVSVALACFAFVVAERARAFPPAGRSAGPTGSQPGSAGTALCGFLHNGTPRDCAPTRPMASPLPLLPPSPQPEPGLESPIPWCSCSQILHNPARVTQ